MTLMPKIPGMAPADMRDVEMILDPPGSVRDRAALGIPRGRPTAR